MKKTLSFRWLGVAGFALTLDEFTLVVDPYFTRIPFIRQFIGRLKPNTALVREKLAACNALLVTHSHWDHLMDVPETAHFTGVPVYGSQNTCQLLQILGVPAKQVHEIKGGQVFSSGPFQIQVIATQHIPVPFFTPGPISSNLHPPLRARDYRMDVSFSFRITFGNITLLTDPGACVKDALPADIVLVNPHYDFTRLRALLDHVQPRLVIPNHWDDMWRPLSKPLRPLWHPPTLSFPPLKRIDLQEFEHAIKQVDGKIKFVIPEMFTPFDLRDVINRA